MPTGDSEEDHHRVEDEERSLTNVSSSASHTTSLLLSSPFQTRANHTGETVTENKAVSMANTDCSSALSSPVEGSPAKPTVTPTKVEATNEKSSATPYIGSSSLVCKGSSLVNISESDSLPSCVLPSKTFGNTEPGNEFPTVLTFKGVSVTLENNSVWKQFHQCGTEMILTKPGRRMFPYCRYRLAGLEPERLYSLVLSIVPSDHNKYRWNTSKWEITGPAEHQAQGVIRAYSHHYSPCRGTEWMGSLVSFYKLKLTNNTQDLEGHIILHSMHRYIPRLHVIPVPDGVIPTYGQPVAMGPESMTFTFPQTEFMAVTTYQNFRITQLKINHNPFAKGFRDDGNNSRLNRVNTGPQHLVKMETQPSDIKPAELNENKEWAVDLSMKEQAVPAAVSAVRETRLVLKPIMSISAHKDESYVPCIRGKHSLGELVLVEKCPRLEPNEENDSVSPIPEFQQGVKVNSKTTSISPTCSTSTPRSSLYRRRRKRINRRWGNARGRDWKAPSASTAVVHSPSLSVSMQPELDDVEGLLFVSFTTKEALEVHTGDKPTNDSSSLPPAAQASPMQLKETVELNPETDEEKIARLEAVLIQDLSSFKHRQVIHPVLQEVGLKLSSLDPIKSVDLQYLGVRLPLPPPNLPEKSNTAALSDTGLPFISRTGKTSDMTKIKGWRNKFIRSKEASSNSDGQQKNLSAFCSNRLDEYLESEAQQISDRAAAFSTNPETSVAYQLPAKSSSYVKTLDSVLKERKSISRFPVGANRPCPLSYKPLLYSALAAPPPPLPSPADQAARSMQQSTSSYIHSATDDAASESGNTRSVSLKLPKHHQGVSQKPAFLQNQGMANKPSSLTKFQFKLLQMEIETLNQGLSRTQLTPDRLSVALSVMLTKEMLPSQVIKRTQDQKYNTDGPECGMDFCRLGCVCSSLNHSNRFPLHCRRPACMFGCACFKRRITKQMSESEYESQPVYTMTKLEHVAQPRPGHANKLWSRNIHDADPEPLFVPKCPETLITSKVLKRSSLPRAAQPMREEDKDPVYKYLESLMTCARVREFNSKPPPIVNIEPKMPAFIENTTSTDHLPKQYYRTVTTVRKTENVSDDSTDSETEARKQIQIQSACDWSKDRKMVIDALCRRMSQKKLSQRFYVGPYRIRPVTKIFMRKPSGSIVTYRVQIGKQPKDSDSDVDEFEDSDEDKQTSKNVNGDMNSKEDDDQMEDSEMWFGVMPFLSRVIPAGRLRALTKPSGCQAQGLIQVNGKSYNQAKLLLGNIGSLHPANRLAAYVTGRIDAPGRVLHKTCQKPDPSQKNNIQNAMCIKAAGTVVPPVITARKTTDLKIPKQQPAQLFQPDSVKRETTPLSQHSQNSTMLFSNQQSPICPFPNSSTSSPVSLTVSPSLKTPSFLGQSGTYSFRICPPANQNTKGHNLPGVTLPGGFTLIQLPKPEASEPEKESDSVKITDITGNDKDLAQKSSVLHFNQSVTANINSLDSDAVNAVKDFSSSTSGRGSSFDLINKEKTQSDKNDENKSRQSNLNMASEDSSSNSSDYCGDDDEDEEIVDVETVEEIKQEMTIAKMKEAVFRALRESRDNFGSATEHGIQLSQDQVDNDESQGNTRRRNHVVLERQRRSEQRSLFDKLQTVLQSDPRSPRLRLLSMALKEIRSLVATSKYLEEQKKSLLQVQALYVKQLSLLSGKSAKMINHKLKEICERQKMREKTMKWKPYFSQLLQSRAALLQAISSQDKLKSAPLLQPDFFMASPQTVPLTTASHNSVPTRTLLLQPNLHKSPAQTTAQTDKATPRSPKAASSPAQTAATAAPAQSESQPSESVTSFQVDQLWSEFKVQEVSGSPAQFITPKSQSLTSTVSSLLDAASVKDSTPKSPNPSKPVTLPLIRSKTGRIILPSSLKPSGQGFYTLMVVKKKGGVEEVYSLSNVPPSDVDSSKNQEKSVSGPEQPSDSENSVLEEDKTASSKLDPKQSVVTTPLTDTAFHNKSSYAPTMPPQASEKSLESNSGVGLKQTLPTTCLKFKRLPTIIKAEPSPNSLEIRRSRGRPRKSITPVNNMNEPEEVARKDVSRQAEETPVPVSEDANNPVPVKRKRGRPPKNTSLSNPPVEEAESSASKSFEDSPVLQSYRKIKPKPSSAENELLADMNKSRPLTRGALGKDFPSAKKRSWIDVEKELEPELESE